MNSKFIEFYFEIAEAAARLSSARRLKVGSVIVRDHKILATGYNGTPTGWDNDCEYKDYDLARDFNGNYFPYSEKEYPCQDQYGRYRLKTKPEVLHSETNAICKVSRSTESSAGATLFCTHAPCLDCAKLIYQSGINSVYYRNQYRDQAGIDFLKKGGIEVEQYPDSRENTDLPK
jgi:dCMP deaminase